MDSGSNITAEPITEKPAGPLARCRPTQLICKTESIPQVESPKVTKLLQLAEFVPLRTLVLEVQLLPKVF